IWYLSSNRSRVRPPLAWPWRDGRPLREQREGQHAVRSVLRSLRANLVWYRQEWCCHLLPLGPRSVRGAPAPQSHEVEEKRSCSFARVGCVRSCQGVSQEAAGRSESRCGGRIVLF